MNVFKKIAPLFLIPLFFAFFIYTPNIYASIDPNDCSQKNVICHHEFINDTQQDPDDGKCIIQNIINDAKDGDIIYIKAGQYAIDKNCPKVDIREGKKVNTSSVAYLLINKSLTIIGDNWSRKEGTIIGPPGPTITESEPIIIEAGASHTYANNKVKLQNLHIKAGTNHTGVILSGSAGSLEVIHCFIEGKINPNVNYYNGVCLQSANKGRNYSNLTIKGSIIKGFNRGIRIPAGGRNDWHKTIDVYKILVANNILYENQTAFSNSSSKLGYYDHKFINNTFAKNDKVALVEGAQGLSSTFGGDWRNNICESWWGPFRVTDWKIVNKETIPIEAKMRDQFHYFIVWRLDNSIDYIYPQQEQHYQITNPQFQNYNNNNFKLTSTSPCKDAGDPNIKDPDGTRSDIGAYGGPGACILDNTLPGCSGAISFKQLLQNWGLSNSIDQDANGIINIIDFSILQNMLK